MPVILFDLDGTLLDHDMASRQAAVDFFRQFSTELPYTEHEFPTIWRSLAAKYNNFTGTAALSDTEQRRRRIDELFAQNTPALTPQEADARFQIYLQAYVDNWRVYDDVLPCLDALASYRLGIVSNGTRRIQSQKLANMALTDRFSAIVFSEDTGQTKPHPDIFLAACRTLQVEPQTCWYIGDRLQTDAEASQTVGMTRVWLNRNGERVSHNMIEIHALTEVLPYLEHMLEERT